MNLKLNDMEKHYLKRLAALQFPGSKDNYSTRHPIHLLQEKSGDYIEIELEDALSEEIATVEYTHNGDYITYRSIDELILTNLGLTSNSQKDIDEYNADALKHNELPFVPLETAYDSHTIPNYPNIIYDIHDYLYAYGIEPSHITCYKYNDGWDDKAVSFTHIGIMEIKDHLSNHLFNPTRTFAFTTTDGDFPILMKVLMKLGQELLDEENQNIHIYLINHMTKEEIMHHYKKTPNTSFCVTSLKVIPDENSKPIMLNITAEGEIRKLDNSEYPVCKIKVLVQEKDEWKEYPWIFECDPYCTAMNDSKKRIQLWNYIQYCKLE